MVPYGTSQGTPMLQIADYDDTALGTGTLTGRAGPDCGKLLYCYQLLTLHRNGNFQKWG